MAPRATGDGREMEARWSGDGADMGPRRRARVQNNADFDPFNQRHPKVEQFPTSGVKRPRSGRPG